MEEEGPLAQADKGSEAFLEQVGPHDHVGLTAFSDEMGPLLDVAVEREPRCGSDHEPDRLGRRTFYDAASCGFKTSPRSAATIRVRHHQCS